MPQYRATLSGRASDTVRFYILIYHTGDDGMGVQVKGILIGGSHFDFTDKESGEQIKGAKLIMAVPAGESRGKIGLMIQELSADYRFVPDNARRIASLAGRRVVVDCDLLISGGGKYLKYRVCDFAEEVAPLAAAKSA